ncbi:MAG: hypothetical protein QM759_10190 [Terricaulis sp.]
MIRPHAWLIAAFAWGVAEATLFFIVPDVILSFIALRRGPRDGLRAALAAALGASAGGIVMYLWSSAAPHAAHAAVSAVPAINEHMIAAAQAAMSAHWFTATMLGPLTSTPFKVYAILAPQAGAPLWAFAIGAVFARLPRFVLAVLAVSVIAPVLRRRLSARALHIVLAVFWVVFYTYFFLRMPSGDAIAPY